MTHTAPFYFARWPDFYAHDYGDEIAYYCSTCHASADWDECDICGGEGESLDETDPVNEPGGEWVSCWQCGGRGGWHFCAECRAKAQGGAA